MVMRQLPVELPPGVYAPGGANAACRRSRAELIRLSKAVLPWGSELDSGRGGGAAGIAPAT
jgi:hypothetical protein